MSQNTPIQLQENSRAAEAVSIRQPAKDDLEHLTQSLCSTILKMLLPVFLENKMEASYGTMVGLLLFGLRQLFEPWLSQHNSVVSFAWLNLYWAIPIGISLVKLACLIFFRHTGEKETRKNLKLIRQRMKQGELTRKQAQGLTAQVLERHIHSPLTSYQQEDAVKNRAEARPGHVSPCFRQPKEESEGPEQRQEPSLPVLAPSLDASIPSEITGLLQEEVGANDFEFSK